MFHFNHQLYLLKNVVAWVGATIIIQKLLSLFISHLRHSYLTQLGSLVRKSKISVKARNHKGNNRCILSLNILISIKTHKYPFTHKSLGIQTLLFISIWLPVSLVHKAFVHNLWFHCLQWSANLKIPVSQSECRALIFFKKSPIFKIVFLNNGIFSHSRLLSLCKTSGFHNSLFIFFSFYIFLQFSQSIKL